MYLASDLKYKFTLKILKYFTLAIALILCFISCKKDDDGSVDSIPANDYTEQHINENDSIIDFMQNHFYNYEDFENDPDNYKIDERRRLRYNIFVDICGIIFGY